MVAEASATPKTYAERSGQPAHRSFFRRKLEQRANPELGGDPVHEYLVDQANARGFFGAYSNREPAPLDDDLILEDIVVGLLQPHAPVEPRILKLVVRILQSGRARPGVLVFHAKRERALPVLRWLVDLIPQPERNEHVEAIARDLDSTPARGERAPKIEYDASRLLRRRGK